VHKEIVGMQKVKALIAVFGTTGYILE